MATSPLFPKSVTLVKPTNYTLKQISAKTIKGSGSLAVTHLDT